MNRRQQIRARIKSLLTFQDSSGYPTDAENRVFTSRYAGVEIEDMPIICIYAYNEQAAITPDSTGYQRTCDVSLVLYVAGGDGTRNFQLKPSNVTDVDDYMDTFCNQVEAVLVKRWNTLYGPNLSDTGIVFRFIYTGVEYFISGEGKEWTGVAIMNFSAEYNENLPDIA
jgi:hypothetical protein